MSEKLPPKKKLASHRDLDVWIKAMDLVEETYRLTRGFPDEERFGLTAQMRRAAVSVPSNIAEGYGRADRGNYRQHVSIANGSLKELETQLIIAGRLQFVSRASAARAWSLLQDVGKMLTRLQGSLRQDG
jgi:four helix bundle protein